VGNALRSHPVLQDIPILALTATAVPRVQQDIADSLQLRNPFIAKQSFDRSNLKIRVLKKTGISGAMKELLQELNGPGIRASKQSTIVYASTRAQVDELAMYLQANVHNGAVRVEAYHAGLSNEVRATAHTNFLTGLTTVIVATVAFGMGIDKPDTRRVIHYGCPKTLEEYYQQIGRAGRDGLPADCVMYTAETDFDRYKSDFYLGKLTGKALQATESSMAALRSYSLNGEICRRKALLNYFHEVPAFGERCGTCDTCQNVATYGADAQRDFGPLGAMIVLQAIDSLKEQGVSNIVKVMAGTAIEGYRYKRGRDPSSVQKAIQSNKENLRKKYTQAYYRDLIGPLTQKGYLTESTQSAKVGGYDRTWTTYTLSAQGGHALSQSLPILLPVPESVRQIEQQEEEKRQKVLAQLEQHGIKRDKLPQDEVEKGDGEVIRAYTKWYSYLENLKKSGRDEPVAQLESLVSVIENWRSETAIKQRMAPASVLAEHTLVSIAYIVATLPPGLKLQSESLEAAGVRTREIGALVVQLGDWVDLVQPAPAAGSSKHNAGAPMVLSEISTNKKWEHAVYKPHKKTGVTVWEASYNRFLEGESPQTIAMSPENGKQPIQVRTVVGHILDAIVQGKRVDLRRLVEFVPAPTQSEWDKLREAEVTTGMDVTGDPNCSGKNGEKFTLTEFLRPIIGDSFVDMPYTERSNADKETFGMWCDLLKWYMALRRAGYEPTFDS
jgi:superfamily II DNA helicase RecQ